MFKLALKLIDKYLGDFIASHEYDCAAPSAKAAHELLITKSGAGNDFLGWVDLPTDYDKSEFKRIKQAALKIQKDSDVLLVIGIGGSYLGARAAIQLLKSELYNDLAVGSPKIYFLGNNISPSYLNSVLKACEGKRISVNIISKSGTTTEPALAFRILKEKLEKEYGVDGAKQRIYCTTDKSKGTLKALADEMGYETFVIPDDVGGRYSVLTAVGLLPIAAAGIPIDDIMDGAKAAQNHLKDFSVDNDAIKYAMIRNILYSKGKSVEMLVSYDPAFSMMNEWFKQLFGESEGKDQKGIFPSSAIFSTDLHSMGQYVQDGKRILFETVVRYKNESNDLIIQEDPKNVDGLNFLAGQKMSFVNEKAFEGTILAHTEGGVPNIILEVDENSPYNFGYMVYFLEFTCAISGYMLGVNPFNQPGVESYKKNMFALLGKPGYESEREKLMKKL